MESVIVYLGISFFIIWIIGFSLTMGAVILSEFVHLGHLLIHKLTNSVTRQMKSTTS